MIENGQKRKRGGQRGISKLPSRIRNRMLAQARVKPLQVLMETMTERWEAAQQASDPETRIKLQNEACAVAEKLAPYFHPKLKVATLQGDPGNTAGFLLDLPDKETLKAAIRGTK